MGERKSAIADVKVNVKISFLKSGNFVFTESLSKKEESKEEKKLVLPYAFPESTNPVSSVLWSASIQ
jgi:hypothetical protein